MLNKSIACAMLLTVTGQLAADDAYKRPEGIAMRPAHTYSIIARDPETGEMGAAVQSHWFSVGSNVIWAEPGVGAVATQSFIDPSYGPNGLAMMRSGVSAADTLKALMAKDDHTDVRQIGMIDANGSVSNFTGENAIKASCGSIGDNFAVQANLMDKDTVCDAMRQVYEATEGDLAERMMAALEAAQAEGGDIRGKQSAAMIVVTNNKNAKAWEDRLFDLRIEDHETPIKELRRLLTTARGYRKMTEGDDYMTEGNVEAALNAYAEAERILPDNHEAVFWHAATLAAIDRVDESLPLFKKAFAKWPKWRELIPRLPASNLLPNDPALIEKILAQ